MQNSLDSINSIHSTHSPNPANVSSPGKRVGECRSNVSSPGKVVGECLSNVSSPGKRVGECLANVSSPGHTRQNGHFGEYSNSPNWRIFGEYSNSTNSPASGHCLIKNQKLDFRRSDFTYGFKTDQNVENKKHQLPLAYYLWLPRPVGV